MSKQHTPGPWIDDDGVIYPENNRGDGMDWIADCRDLPNQKADARLIAAAPDLLAACEACERAWNTTGLSNGAIREAREAVRVAIAKAKGRAP